MSSSTPRVLVLPASYHVHAQLSRGQQQHDPRQGGNIDVELLGAGSLQLLAYKRPAAPGEGQTQLHCTVTDATTTQRSRNDDGDSDELFFDAEELLELHQLDGNEKQQEGEALTASDTPCYPSRLALVLVIDEQVELDLGTALIFRLPSEDGGATHGDAEEAGTAVYAIRTQRDGVVYEMLLSSATPSESCEQQLLLRQQQELARFIVLFEGQLARHCRFVDLTEHKTGQAGQHASLSAVKTQEELQREAFYRAVGEKVASGINRGASQLSAAIGRCGAATGERLRASAQRLRTTSAPRPTPLQVDPRVRSGVASAAAAASTTSAVLGDVCGGLSAVAQSLGETVHQALKDRSETDSRLQPGPRMTAACKVGIASLLAFKELYSAVTSAGMEVLKAGSEAGTEIVGHKYGGEAGEVTRDGLSIVQSVAESSVAYKRIGISSFARQTATGAASSANNTVDDDARDRSGRDKDSGGSSGELVTGIDGSQQNTGGAPSTADEDAPTAPPEPVAALAFPTVPSLLPG
mmetsp:Transcript_1725/g.6067  ORF Transcript_1725/g.6067 Transcript_1725/m.6067 type:complete len:523 (-) Transcript_1725:43-1611(-)